MVETLTANELYLITPTIRTYLRQHFPPATSSILPLLLSFLYPIPSTRTLLLSVLHPQFQIVLCKLGLVWHALK